MIIRESASKIQKTFIVLLVSVFTLLFLYMIRNFLTSIVLAAIFTGMFYPFYRKLLRVFRNKKYAASGATVFMTPDWLPFVEFLEPYKEQIFETLDVASGKVISFLADNLSTFGQGTISLIMNVFVLLYAMYFFFIQGKRLLSIAQDFVPLTPKEFHTILDQGMVVTFATLKGAAFIGILQGALVGIGFWFLDIQGAVFWGTIAAVVSVVPTFGSALIWFPAVIFFFLTNDIFSAVLLLAWGAGVIGVIDNLLRPYVVGKEAHMPDLLVLVSTLGGLGLFGATGFIIGPVLAALLNTIWGIFKQTFETELN